MDTQFKFQGKKYVVSFTMGRINAYDPGFRLNEDGKKRFTALGSRRRIKRNRQMVFCVIRKRYTGMPFSGVAVLAPRDKKDNLIANGIAVRKAIQALAAHEYRNEPRYHAALMYHTYLAEIEQDFCKKTELLDQIELIRRKHDETTQKNKKTAKVK